MSDPARASALRVQQATRPVRILIIDDNPVDRSLYCQMLRDAEGTYEVQEVGSAEAAAQWLARQPAPDCLLLDHCLPGINGVEFLRRLAQADNGMRAPVVMLTAMADDALSYRALQAGASAILSKDGVTALTLRAAVNTALQLEAPRRAFEAEYEYASIAYTGQVLEATPERLAQFAIALELFRLVRSLRRNEVSMMPRGINPRHL